MARAYSTPNDAKKEKGYKPRTWTRGSVKSGDRRTIQETVQTCPLARDQLLTPSLLLSSAAA
jgi:hypothetical protein